MTYGFLLIRGTQYILNFSCGVKILYLFLIVVQALSLNYLPLLAIHLILVGSSIVRHTFFPYDLLGLFIIHHDEVHCFLLLATL